MVPNPARPATFANSEAMTSREDPDHDPEFAALARARPRGATRELFDFLVHNKKWWLVPIVIALLALGVLVAVAGSSVGPFLYTVF